MLPKRLSDSFTHNQGPEEEGDGLVELQDVEKDHESRDEKLQPCGRHVCGFNCHSKTYQGHKQGPLRKSTQREREGE